MLKYSSFCYCCHKDKNAEHFDIHGDGRFKLFCKDCYKTYRNGERKSRQVKYVFDTIKKMKDLK